MESVQTPKSKASWIYVSLAVVDGARTIKPAQVSFDCIIFRTPPHITSERVEIILTNGDETQRQMAIVLPHDPEATRIPIRLVKE